MFASWIIRQDLTLSCLKKTDVRAHSTMKNSIWSASRHMRLKVSGPPCWFQPLCSCRRRAADLFCSCSSSGSQRRNSMTSGGTPGPGGGLGDSSSEPASTLAAEPGELTWFLSSDLIVQLERKLHWSWLSQGELEGRSELTVSVCAAGSGLLWRTGSGWKAQSLLSGLNPPDCITALLCCLRARSRLYMGPNLFLPPLMRSARTAGDKCYYVYTRKIKTRYSKYSRCTQPDKTCNPVWSHERVSSPTAVKCANVQCLWSWCETTDSCNLSGSWVCWSLSQGHTHTHAQHVPYSQINLIARYWAEAVRTRENMQRWLEFTRMVPQRAGAVNSVMAAATKLRLMGAAVLTIVVKKEPKSFIRKN